MSHNDVTISHEEVNAKGLFVPYAISGKSDPGMETIYCADGKIIRRGYELLSPSSGSDSGYSSKSLPTGRGNASNWRSKQPKIIRQCSDPLADGRALKNAMNARVRDSTQRKAQIQRARAQEERAKARYARRMAVQSRIALKGVPAMPVKSQPDLEPKWETVRSKSAKRYGDRIIRPARSPMNSALYCDVTSLDSHWPFHPGMFYQLITQALIGYQENPDECVDTPAEVIDVLFGTGSRNKFPTHCDTIREVLPIDFVIWWCTVYEDVDNLRVIIQNARESGDPDWVEYKAKYIEAINSAGSPPLECVSHKVASAIIYKMALKRLSDPRILGYWNHSSEHFPAVSKWISGRDQYIARTVATLMDERANMNDPFRLLGMKPITPLSDQQINDKASEMFIREETRVFGLLMQQ